MAKSTLLESGEIIPVFYPLGTFNSDQRPRYVRASFVMLKLNNEEYVMPISGPGDSRDLQNILGSSDYNLEQIMSRSDFGFESDDEIVVGEHELGTGARDDWKSVHKFGLI